MALCRDEARRRSSSGSSSTSTTACAPAERAEEPPELMQLLARARASRPAHRRLVMLERLAALGVQTEAATSEDSGGYRATGLAACEERLAALPAGAAALLWRCLPSSAGRGRRHLSQRRRRSPRAARSSSVSRAAAAKTAAPVADVPPAPVPALVGDAADALRFTTLSFTPAGLAYDHVSNRFIVGDRDANKLTVVDEASQRVANLAGAVSAGFGEIAALEIDPREGDLWVVSSMPSEPREGGGDKAATLPSCSSSQAGCCTPRPRVGSRAGPIRGYCRDPGELGSGADSLGQRVFVAAPGARRLALAVQLDATEIRVSPLPGARRLCRRGDGHRAPRLADPPPGRSRLSRHQPGGITSCAGTTGRGRGPAVGDGTIACAVQVDRSGLRVSAAEVLDRDLRMPDPRRGAAGSVFYYLAATRVPRQRDACRNHREAGDTEKRAARNVAAPAVAGAVTANRGASRIAHPLAVHPCAEGCGLRCHRRTCSA